MSGRVTRLEFENLAVEIEDLREQVAVLRLEKETLEGRVAELENEVDSTRESFSVVSAPPPIPEVQPAASELPADRVELARRIGHWLRRCLDGRPRGLPGREGLKQASKIYVVARDIQGNLFGPPKIFYSWAEAKGLVSRQGHLGDSVFIGLPSTAEGRVVVSTAGLALPAALIPNP